MGSCGSGFQSAGSALQMAGQPQPSGLRPLIPFPAGGRLPLVISSGAVIVYGNAPGQRVGIGSVTMSRCPPQPPGGALPYVQQHEWGDILRSEKEWTEGTLEVEHLSRWRTYFERTLQAMESHFRIQLDAVSGGTLICTSSLYVLQGHEYGPCLARCVVCSPHCGGLRTTTQQGTCITPGHMSLAQAALRLSVGHGLCTTCHRYFGISSTVHKKAHIEGSNTQECVAVVNNYTKVKQQCEQQIIRITRKMGEAKSPLPEGLGFTDRFGRRVAGYQQMIELCQLTKSRSCERVKGDCSLSQFRYAAARIMEWCNSFDAFVNRLQFVFIDTQARQMADTLPEADGAARRGKKHPVDALNLLDTL